MFFISETKQNSKISVVDVRKIAVVSMIAGLLALKVSGATIDENILLWYAIFCLGPAVTMISFMKNFRKNEANIGKKQNLFVLVLGIAIYALVLGWFSRDNPGATWMRFVSIAFGLGFVMGMNMVMGIVLGVLMANVLEIIKDDINLRKKIIYAALLFLASAGMCILFVNMVEPKRIVPMLPVVGVLLGSLAVPIAAVITKQNSIREAVFYTASFAVGTSAAFLLVMAEVNSIESIWQADSTMIYLKYMAIGLIVGTVSVAIGNMLDRLGSSLQKIRGISSAEN